MSKAVVYYSLSGNTKEAAVEIARKLGAKIFEIEPVKPLPQNTVRQKACWRNAVNIWQETTDKRCSR